MHDDTKVKRTIAITPEMAATIADWADMEQCSEEEIWDYVVERGLAAVNYELNQRWINRDIRSGILSKETPSTASGEGEQSGDDDWEPDED